MARTEERQWTGATTGGDGEDLVATILMTDTTQLFYFAGRPVAQLTTGPELLYLTTDHLGTPVLATDSLGRRGLGRRCRALRNDLDGRADNPDLSASTAGGLVSTTAPAISRLFSERVFLRYPGQWASDAFRVANIQQEIYYNLYRWYQPLTGRYPSPDPALGVDALRRAELFGLGVGSPYGYTDGNPINRSDPRGASWYDWIPLVKPIKCVYYGNQCTEDIQCCLQGTGLGNPYAGDEEEMARRFQRFGGRASPQWVECVQKVPACSKWLEYCGGFATSPTHKIPGMGRDPGAAKPLLSGCGFLDWIFGGC